MPLAATAAVVLLGAVVLRLTVGDVGGHGVLVGLLLLAPASLLATRLLFLRTRDSRRAYFRAIVWPLLLGVVVGPAVAVYLRWSHPDADYSFGGPPIIDVGDFWPLFVALGSAMVAGVASALLVFQVWLVTRSERRRVAAWAWGSVLVLGGLTVPFDAAVACVGIACAVAGITLQAISARLERKHAAPSVGPYRSVV